MFLVPYSVAVLVGIGMLPADPQRAHCMAGIVRPDSPKASSHRPSPARTRQWLEARHDAERTAALIDRQSVHPTVRSLLLPVAGIESRFRASVRSHTGAKGLLQITGIAEKQVHMFPLDPGYPGLIMVRTDKNRLYDPVYNVNIGAAYLQYCWEETGSVVLALMMYNGGKKQVNSFLRGQPVAQETETYVLRVLRLQEACPD